MNYKSIRVPLDDSSESKILQVQSLYWELESASMNARARMNFMKNNFNMARSAWDQMMLHEHDCRDRSVWNSLSTYLEEFKYYRNIRSESIQRMQNIKNSIADIVGSSNSIEMNIPDNPYGFFVKGSRCMLTVFGVLHFEINLSVHDGLVLMKTQSRGLHQWCIDRDDLVEINMDSFLLVDPVEGQTAQDRMYQAVAVCESISQDIDNSFEF